MKPGSPGWGHDTNPLVLTVAEGKATELTSPNGNWPAYYAAMRDAIRGEGEVPVTTAQATTLMAVIEAGLQSSDEGRVIRPNYTKAEQTAWRRTI